MTTTAQALLEGAYTRSASNDAGKLASDAELLAHLGRVYHRAWPLVARARPDQFGATLALTLAGIPPTAALPADVIDVLAVQTATGTEVAVIPSTERAKSWHLAPAVYRLGLTLVSRNRGGDPISGAVLTATVLDAPAALPALTSTLDPRWPVRHTQLLVDLLAVYLSVKDTGRSAGEHAKVVAELQQSAGAFAAEFNLPPAAVEWMHAPVERAEGKG